MILKPDNFDREKLYSQNIIEENLVEKLNFLGSCPDYRLVNYSNNLVQLILSNFQRIFEDAWALNTEL